MPLGLSPAERWAIANPDLAAALRQQTGGGSQYSGPPPGNIYNPPAAGGQSGSPAPAPGPMPRPPYIPADVGTPQPLHAPRLGPWVPGANYYSGGMPGIREQMTQAIMSRWPGSVRTGTPPAWLNPGPMMQPLGLGGMPAGGLPVGGRFGQWNQSANRPPMGLGGGMGGMPTFGGYPQGPTNQMVPPWMYGFGGAQ